MGQWGFDLFWGQIGEKHALSMHFSTNSTQSNTLWYQFKAVIQIKNSYLNFLKILEGCFSG